MRGGMDFMERKYRKMEDNKTIAEMNAEADDKLIAWSLQMIREDRVDFSKFTLNDLFSCLLEKGFFYSYADYGVLDGREHVLALLKNNGFDDDDYYSDDVGEAIAACLRKRKRNRCVLVMYGVLLYVLRSTDYGCAEWKAEDFDRTGSDWKTICETPVLWGTLLPVLLAEARGLTRGRDPLAELQGFPAEFIVERLKTELPDSIIEALNKIFG